MEFSKGKSNIHFPSKLVKSSRTTANSSKLKKDHTFLGKCLFVSMYA